MVPRKSSVAIDVIGPMSDLGHLGLDKSMNMVYTDGMKIEIVDGRRWPAFENTGYPMTDSAIYSAAVGRIIDEDHEEALRSDTTGSGVR
jgi:hypothetical protein